jgi:8-oxo-dGTP pyrophosphatase MutT (NUDIX family)
VSFLDRIVELNRHEISNFVPFYAGSEQIGFIARDKLHMLAPYEDVLPMDGERVEIAPRISHPDERSAIFREIALDLHRRGALSRWRDEPYAVLPLSDRLLAGKPLFILERAAIAFFGIRAFGVHVNGYVGSPERCELWIAHRSRSSAVHPGRLDNMVAGGQPAGMSIFENMAKEAAEEADIDEALASQARESGFISYRVETVEGLSTATMFVYDLELPPDFTPRNTDGELQGFDRLPLREVMTLVAETHEFKPNSNLVIIDFLLRHGVLHRGHADCPEILERLRS